MPLGGPPGARPAQPAGRLRGHAGQPGAADRRHVGRRDQPAGAANTVQVYVSRLRRALQPPEARPGHAVRGRRLPARPPRRRGRHRPVRAAGRARAQPARPGRPGGGRRALAEAVAMWRGPALPDLERRRRSPRCGPGWTGALVTAQAEHADTQIALGHAEQAVAELEPLVRLHPLDEGLVVRLMTALYHSGRQADALAAYAAATAGWPTSSASTRAPAAPGPRARCCARTRAVEPPARRGRRTRWPARSARRPRRPAGRPPAAAPPAPASGCAARAAS